MPEQLSLPGLKKTALDNLFFAVLPDQCAADRAGNIAEDLRRARGLTGRPLALRRFHVSLYGLGAYAGVPNDVIARARAAAAAVSGEPFEIVFDRAASFPIRQSHLPLVLRGHRSADPLIALYGTLGAALARTGLAPVSRHFTPHMTLLYDTRLVVPCSVEPVAWTAREFVLIHSRVGLGQHIPLGRWSLER
jgi:2'-5' RNA ligase